jgi:hypothetical protein
MAEKRLLRPFAITSFVALVGFLAAFVGPSMTWAITSEKPQMKTKRPTMRAPETPTASSPPAAVLTTPTPTTVDDYASYVQDALQVEAMKIKTPGTADVRLTIGKDGSVQQTEVTRLDGPPALRDQITSMARQMKLPPLPATTTVNELVVDSTVAFDYPGSNMMDHFSRVPRSR